MLKNKHVQRIAQIALSAIVLSWLVWRVGPEAIANTLVDVHWKWYGLAFLLFLINVVVRAYRWLTLLRALNDRPSFVYLTYLYFVGFFANNFIPSGFGGDVVKVVSLRQTYGQGAEALSSVVIDRLTGLTGSALIAFGVLVWNTLSRSMTIDLPAVLWIVVTAISLGLPFGFLLVRRINFLDRIEHLWPAIQRLPKYGKVKRLLLTVRRYPRSALLRSLSITVPFTFILILTHYSISQAVSVNLPLPIFSLFVPIIAIASLLPISFNGLGVREGVYFFLFVPVGVAPDKAIAMSLAFYFLRFTTGLLGGLLYVTRNISQLIHPSQAENL